MADLRISEADLEFLRSCPRVLVIHRMPHGKSDYQEQYARLRGARLISGTIDIENSSRDLAFVDVALTNAGRRAIGLPEHAEAAGGDQHA